MITKRELSKQLTALAAETGRQINTLRDDMAAEFVKRDTVIEAHTAHLETFHKLVQGWAKDLEKLDTLAKRLEVTQESLIMDRLFIRGLMKAVGLTETQLEVASRYASAKYDEYKKGEPLYTEPKMETEAALFGEAEEKVPEIQIPFNGEGEWISFAEAKRRVGIISHPSVKHFCELYNTIFRQRGPHRVQVFYNDAMLTMERKMQPKRRKETTPRERHEGMKQMQTWAKIYNKKQEQFTRAITLLGIMRRQGNKKHIQYCFLTPEEAKKINDTIEYLTK